MLEETAQVIYLLVAIKSAQCQTKISSLKQLLCELQKILRCSRPLRRLVITKGGFEQSRQFLHLFVSAQIQLSSRRVSVVLKRINKPKKKSNSKNSNTPTEYHQSRTNSGFPTLAANVRPQPTCIKSHSPQRERNSSLASVRQ